jgi:hypothetical protein
LTPFELRPAAAVGVTGLVTGHFGGQFCVELVGGFGDVAQSGGLAGSFGEGALRQAVVGCLLGILDRSFEQDVGVHEFVHHAHRVSLCGLDDLAEEACAHRRLDSATLLKVAIATILLP